MAELTSINPEEIEATAQSIKTQNNKIRETLENTASAIRSLQSTWTGEAAEETQQAYKQFADRYFDRYEQILNDYVEFLQDTAAEEWRKTNLNAKKQADNIRSLIS